MPLLERDEALADLHAALGSARRGEGRVALVSGGAGLGKTSVVRAFLAGVGTDVAVREGACDDLLTPRPLGPIHDLSRRSGPALARALAGGDVHAVFTALLDELAGGAPTVVVVEDVHWADDASLDALAFVARRIERLPALLVLTYRDDDLSAEAPLRRVLGGLRAPAAVRIALAPLSPHAVVQLAGQEEAGRRLYASTGGNPFFVTELLAAEHEGTPASVSHAVMARVARLPPPTRELLDLLAVVPARTEAALLDVLCPGWPERAAVAEERGVVVWQGDGLAFRHELARRAVEEALPASRARGLHARVLAALQAAGADPARLVHHADRAADLDTLVVVAPLAARAAAAAGAHREATAHYRRALELGDRYSDAERAELLEAFTVEASTTCRIGEALRAAERALALREARGEASGIGRNLRRLSQLYWYAGRRDDMERRLAAALEVLEGQPPGPEHAMAYSDLAMRIGLYGGRREEAERTADRAVDLAERCGDPAALGHVRGRIGLLRATLDGDDTVLRDCLRHARTTGAHFDAGLAYEGLAAGAALRRDRAATRRWIAEGIDYLQPRDILGPLQYLRGLQAAQELADGDWAGAERSAAWVLAQPEGRGITGIYALVTEALLRLRRGRVPEAAATLDELWTVAETCGMVQHVAPAACVLAEHAELTGRWDGAVAPLQEARGLAQRLGLAGVASELGFWLCRAGALDPAELGPPDPDDPYALAAAGEWHAAAAVWERWWRPFDRARALAAADDQQALLTALDIATDLGAEPLAARLRARLRGFGVRRVPRGPRPVTRANPAGLTARQLEVLALLCEGLTDAEIARRLVLSVKTVNHHVSAVLDKLGADNRRDAVRIATGSV